MVPEGLHRRILHDLASVNDYFAAAPLADSDAYFLEHNRPARITSTIRTPRTVTLVVPARNRVLRRLRMAQRCAPDIMPMKATVGKTVS